MSIVLEYAKHDAVPGVVLRPVPDDGLWDIRFGRAVRVTFGPAGALVEPMDDDDAAELCVARRLGDIPPAEPVTLWGAPTEWMGTWQPEVG